MNIADPGQRRPVEKAGAAVVEPPQHERDDLEADQRIDQEFVRQPQAARYIEVFDRQQQR